MYDVSSPATDEPTALALREGMYTLGMADAGAGATNAPHPERVGRYDILLPIASGGMATVYLGRSRAVGGFHRDVAIKVTHAHLRDTPEFAFDLLEEAKLAVRIKHPNVVPTLDVGEDPLGLFLVMDYVEGDTLSGLHRAASAASIPDRTAIALRILIDALWGLHAAHDLRDDAGSLLGLVHRDFSPQNILVGVDGVSRLADFGVAKAANRLGHTRTGLVKGKIAYMAPEQAKGHPIDRRCDVWAAGVVAWQLLARRRLYPGDNDVCSLLKIVTEPPPRLREVAPELPREFDDAVARALTMDLQSRCPSAADFARDLTAACRAARWNADITDVAEFVARLAGPKLAARRARVTELLELRAKMGKLTETPDATGLTPSSNIARVVVQRVASGEGAEARRTQECEPPDAPTIARLIGPETLPTVYVDVRAPFARPDSAAPTRTDTTSVSTPDLPVTGPSVPRRAPRGVIAGAAAGLAVLASLALVGPRLFRSEETSRAAASATATATAALAPPPIPLSIVSPQEPTPAPAATTFVALHANAPIAAVKVDGRAVPLANAARDVDVELFATERGRVLRIDAVAVDGAVASAKLAANATALTLAFRPKTFATGARPTTATASGASTGAPVVPKKLPQSPYEPK